MSTFANKWQKKISDISKSTLHSPVPRFPRGTRLASQAQRGAAQVSLPSLPGCRAGGWRQRPQKRWKRQVGQCVLCL